MRAFGCLRVCRSFPLCQSFLLAAGFGLRLRGWRVQAGGLPGLWPYTSITIKDEDVAVFERDLDGFSGFGALVEPVGMGWHFIVWNPFADSLPGWFDNRLST